MVLGYAVAGFGRRLAIVHIIVHCPHLYHKQEYNTLRHKALPRRSAATLKTDWRRKIKDGKERERGRERERNREGKKIIERKRGKKIENERIDSKPMKKETGLEARKRGKGR